MLIVRRQEEVMSSFLVSRAVVTVSGAVFHHTFGLFDLSPSFLDGPFVDALQIFLESNFFFQALRSLLFPIENNFYFLFESPNDVFLLWLLSSCLHFYLGPHKK